MSPKTAGFGLVVAVSLAAGGPVMAQVGNPNQGAGPDAQPVKPTGPAAKKADDLIRGYTARIEKEVEQGRKEVERLRAELHELIDVRYDMSEAIAELHGELAAKGTYSADPVMMQGQTNAEDSKPAAQARGQGMGIRRDLLYGFGSALPTDPTAEEREQIRRLAPRADVKRMIERLRSEVEGTRTEVDQLAYRLLELRAGVPFSRQRFAGMGGGMGGMGGGMGGMGGGMGGMGGGMGGHWFGSMERPMHGGAGGGMR